MTDKIGYLVLADGSLFKGYSFGYPAEVIGEVCFNTSMTGYQEIVTDPSYTKQIVTMTYPEIGNYGINIAEDSESKNIQVSALVVKNYCPFPSNWRSGTYKTTNLSQTLQHYLVQNKIPAIQGIDTRSLTRILRDKGAQNGIISFSNKNIDQLIKQAKEIPAMEGCDLVKEVTTPKIYQWQEREHSILNPLKNANESTYKVVVIDLGVKYNILRKLYSLGAEVWVVPATTCAKDIMSLSPTGIMLSNGPGDPKPVDYVINTIKSLLGTVPIFGICLGHQILSLALGASTYKLKFGHRGANHPIKNLANGTVAITSQNHGFAVDAKSVDQSTTQITHLNLNDQTVAGIRHKQSPAFSVQYHPEASPGPQDSNYLFEHFFDLMKSAHQ